MTNTNTQAGEWVAVGNPGSDAALAAGCICAVMDNCHGKFAPWPPDNWWITEGCPIHSAVRAGGVTGAQKEELGDG